MKFIRVIRSAGAINFSIGRLLGDRFIRKLIPAGQLEKFDTFISHQGIVVLLFLFMFPGFPKDYLCLLLGVSILPFKIFILLAGFGRMPGTLMLSLQGEYLFTRNYSVFGAILLVSLIVVVLAVKYRKALYEWARTWFSPSATSRGLRESSKTPPDRSDCPTQKPSTGARQKRIARCPRFLPFCSSV